MQVRLSGLHYLGGVHLITMPGFLCLSNPRPLRELVDHRHIVDRHARRLCRLHYHRGRFAIPNAHRLQQPLQMADDLGAVATLVCRRREHKCLMLLLPLEQDGLQLVRVICCPSRTVDHD